MPLTALIFGNAPTNTSIANTLVLDAALKVVTKRKSTPTKFPVESGADITDHSKLDNLTVQLTGVVSEAPLSLLASVLGGIVGTGLGTIVGGFGASLATGLGAAIGTAEANFALSPDIPDPDSLKQVIKNRIPGDAEYPKKALDYLLALQEKREPFDVVTGFKKYTNMIINDFDAPQESKTGGSLFFTATLEQIQIVESKTALVPENIIDIDAAPSAASGANVGKQSASPASLIDQLKVGSVLDTVFGGGA